MPAAQNVSCANQDAEWARITGHAKRNEVAGTRTQGLRIKSPLLYRLSYNLRSSKTPFFPVFSCDFLPLRLYPNRCIDTRFDTKGPFCCAYDSKVDTRR